MPGIFQQIGVKKAVNVIPNAVELDDFSPDRISAENKSAFRRRYHIPDDVMVACFVGRLGHEKSVDVLLDYWARTITPEDKIMLCIIGGGPVQDALSQSIWESILWSFSPVRFHTTKCLPIMLPATYM